MATILIANADHRFSQTLKNVLSAYGHEIVIARTGEETVQRFDERQPAVVLLDLVLLGLSGLDALAKLKARDPRLPVVVVTGDVTADVENRAREMGVLDVLRKRLKMDVIMQAVNRALQEVGKPAKAAPASVAPAGVEPKPATILIVDDEREICDLVGEFLQRRGYRVKTAYGGEAALASVKQEPPDLVLLDIYMPDINGVEVLRRLVKNKFAGGVIMLTASQEEPLLKTALDLGAFDVLSKPVDLDQVEMAVMVKLMLNAPD
ncbi:MAG: response regulator [Nitrospirae bacterium]|nr:MAG: response regulator [Nitrospirota bacterium]